MRCGQQVRLRHVGTRNYLHSHLHAAPMTPGGQEVSGYVGSDTGDNWALTCVAPAIGGAALRANPKGRPDEWRREAGVRLQHVDTGRFLSASKRRVFGHPISGQLEVKGMGSAGADEVWRTLEGIYLARNQAAEGEGAAAAAAAGSDEL